MNDKFIKFVLTNTSKIIPIDILSTNEGYIVCAEEISIDDIEYIRRNNRHISENCFNTKFLLAFPEWNYKSRSYTEVIITREFIHNNYLVIKSSYNYAEIGFNLLSCRFFGIKYKHEEHIPARDDIEESAIHSIGIDYFYSNFSTIVDGDDLLSILSNPNFNN